VREAFVEDSSVTESMVSHHPTVGGSPEETAVTGEAEIALEFPEKPPKFWALTLYQYVDTPATPVST